MAYFLEIITVFILFLAPGGIELEYLLAASLEI